MTQNTDHKILYLLKENPEEGMSLLIEQYMGLLWSACRLYLDNPEDIRECVQDTLLDFYEHKDHFQEEKGTLKAYLYVIAKRKAIQTARKNGAAVMEELTDALPDADVEDQLLDRIVLEQALAQLNEQDSRMIRMRYYEGMTCTQIAHEMNLPVETVKKRQQRSLKRLQRILIALVILGILTACAAAVVYRYRFSPSTGFQEQDTDIWMEMAGEPAAISTEYGDVTIQNVVWKEQRLLLELDIYNQELKDGSMDIRLVSGDTGWHRTDMKRSWQTSDIPGTPIDVKSEFQNVDAAEQFTFLILGTEHTVTMKPIGQYEYLQDIGSSQTHNGRTIVLQSEQTDDALTLKAYTYSENAWKIIGFDHFMERTSWKKKNLADGYYFTREISANQEDTDTIEISAVQLQSQGETPIVKLPVPKGTVEVDIPFVLGEDTYRIAQITYAPEAYEYFIVDEDGHENAAYGDELQIQIEPVSLEENTRYLGIYAELGSMEPRYTYVYDPKTGQRETKESTEIFRGCYSNNLFMEYESVIRMQLNKDTELPDEVYLRINNILKEWEQPYIFPKGCSF